MVAILQNAMTFYMGRGGKKSGYTPGRDPVVDDVMKTWTDKYCTFLDANICISTFNVNGKSPPSCVPLWFPEDKKADFYAIGMQEMDLSVGTYIIENSKKEFEWLDCIKRSLPESETYDMVASQRLVGIFIVLFKARSCSIRTTDIKTGYIATGISVLVNKLGNKGGTGISIKMNDTTVCFLNSHMAAGNNELERRNQDYRDISGLQFAGGLSIWDHDIVFWFGDLNYRIANEVNKSNDQIREICLGPKFAEIYNFDQLHRERTRGTVFVGFDECTPIPFRPTYKYDVGTSNWDSSEKARAPAWCDRVLWRTRDSDIHVVQTRYESVDQIVISDHKPVRSTFLLTLKQIDQKRADRLYEDAIREADRRANELLPHISLSTTEIEFGDVFFLDPCCKSVIVKNVGKSTVKLKFMPRPSNNKICASWMQVTPSHYTLPTGQEVQISLTIVIDKKTSWELCAMKDPRLNDILVMNLEHGRDYFIPISARYEPKVFGVPLNHLLTRNNTVDNLIDFGDSSSASNCPDGVPMEVYRLVSALRQMGHDKLDLEELVDNSVFCAIRQALENDAPHDLSLIPEVTPFGLYSALITLIDSIQEPLIPTSRHETVLVFWKNPAKLWGEIMLLPPANCAIIEFLTSYLRELFSVKGTSQEQVRVWSTVLFREESPLAPSTPREQVLLCLISYARDVSIFCPTLNNMHISHTQPNLQNHLLYRQPPTIPAPPPHKAAPPAIPPPPAVPPRRNGSNLF